MAHLFVAAITSLAVLVIAVFATVPTYHAAPASLLPVLWGVYFLRRRLHVHPVHYALFGVAILLHMLGAFGYYRSSPLPFSYDILLHFYFPMVIALALHRLLSIHYPRFPWHVAVVTFFIMMGLGALHEIMEYCTYLVLGEERGMLKPTTSYFFDTQRDLTNNLLGTLTALVLTEIARRTQRSPSIATSQPVPQAAAPSPANAPSPVTASRV